MCIPENCTKCKFHKILDDPDPHDPFCDDDLAVQCTRSDKEPQRNEFGSYTQMEPMVTVGCRPYRVTAESSVPEWYPLKIDKSARIIEVYHRGYPDIYDIYEIVTSVNGLTEPRHILSRGAPDNVLTLLAELSEKRPLKVKFIDQTTSKIDITIGGQWPNGMTQEPMPKPI